MKTVYEFVGGRFHNMRMPFEAVVAIGNGRYSIDWSADREKGALVPREELDSQPLVDGYCGPMYDGVRRDLLNCEVYQVLRYESHSVYDRLSR